MNSLWPEGQRDCIRGTANPFCDALSCVCFYGPDAFHREKRPLRETGRHSPLEKLILTDGIRKHHINNNLVHLSCHRVPKRPVKGGHREAHIQDVPSQSLGLLAEDPVILDPGAEGERAGPGPARNASEFFKLSTFLRPLALGKLCFINLRRDAPGSRSNVRRRSADRHRHW